MRYNRNNRKGNYNFLYNDIPKWEKILASHEFPNELFDNLGAEGYNYLLQQCYELADLYNLTTKNNLRRRVAEESHYTQDFQILPTQAVLTDSDTGTREWTHESNYAHWINQYYTLSSRNKNLRRAHSVIRGQGGVFISRRDRQEIARIEADIRANNDILADVIHRINTSYYRNRHGVLFLTIDDSLSINETQNTDRTQNIITENTRYHIQEFDRALVRTLTMTQDGLSNAFLFSNWATTRSSSRG
jgi:hypothetical protein